MSDELVEICDSCNEPTELIEWEDIIENSYGNGELVSERVILEGSQCCGSETTEWPIGYWAEEHPKIALEMGYITQEEYNRIMEELE